jgi:hypothetical protein
MMNKKSILLIISYGVLIFSISFVSCKHDILIPADYGYKGPCNCPDDVVVLIPCNPDTVYFSNTILPLIQSSCGIPNQPGDGCHDAGASGELNPLIDYTTIMNSGYVVAGNSNNSDMYDKITKTDPLDRMPPPPTPPLTQEQINLIKKWIDQGAKNNYCTSCDTTAFKFGADIWPIIDVSCKGCHGTTNPAKGVQLTNYTQVKAIVDDGRLKNVLYATNGYKQMPIGGKLNNCKLTKINKWIANGAPND